MATLESAQPAVLAAPSWGWLRHARFDLLFIVGITVLAVSAAGLTLAAPVLFPLVLVADLWLLGYHHVISTFTRLAFDSESFRANRFLVVWLPLIVLAGVIGLVAGVGWWAVPTLYLYWQWFHYTRQSYGIAQIYRRKAGGLADDPPRLAKATIYLLPLWGILSRSAEGHRTFLGMPIKTLPVPWAVVAVVAAAALISIVWWLVRQLAAWRQGRLPAAHALYMASHLVIFALGYLVIPDLSAGWLAINVWHNAQYIVLVWMYNNNRFKGGVDPRHRFLSTISQTNRALLYVVVCLGITAALYAGLSVTLEALGLPLVAATLIAYQAINFHHYIVDGVIWKVRKAPIRENLGLAT